MAISILESEISKVMRVLIECIANDRNILQSI